ncbi:MAG: hypothetical protein K6A78_10470, partial [Prevotella sp.]|nr:hypothetical protein [Prevotella sp.]
MGFCIQFNFGKPTQPVTEEFFYKVVRSKHWKNVINEVRVGKEMAKEAAESGDMELAKKFKDEADEKKKKLPGFIFQSTFLETEAKKSKKVAPWRKQEATVLNGLCMIDVDHLEDAKGTYEGFKAKVDFSKEDILLVYVTPSGHGLKIVFKARLDWGNLIDNQHQMAKRLGVEVDEACKDASRLSFICTEEDILFINKEIFSYENKEYSERWSKTYRQGDSQPTLFDNGALDNSSSMGDGDAHADSSMDGGQELDADGDAHDENDEVKGDENNNDAAD